MTKRKTILVVEDDHQLRQILRRALEREGHKIQTATDGNIALQLLESEEPPSLVLLDLMMPVIDGLEFLRIKATKPAIASIPVIALSAAARPGDAAGLVAFLEKPADLDELLKLIRTHLR